MYDKVHIALKGVSFVAIGREQLHYREYSVKLHIQVLSVLIYIYVIIIIA